MKNVFLLVLLQGVEEEQDQPSLTLNSVACDVRHNYDIIELFVPELFSSTSLKFLEKKIFGSILK